MFLNSIRWRLQLWLAFLLIAVLTGFGTTVYQLYRLTQLNQLDEELRRRVAILSTSLRGGPLSSGERDRGPRRQPPDRSRSPAGFDERGSRPNFSDESPGPAPEGSSGGGRFPFGPRRVQVTAELASLFDESQSNGFYFVIWSRD